MSRVKVMMNEGLCDMMIVMEDETVPEVAAILYRAWRSLRDDSNQD